MVPDSLRIVEEVGGAGGVEMTHYPVEGVGLWEGQPLVHSRTFVEKGIVRHSTKIERGLVRNFCH